MSPLWTAAAGVCAGEGPHGCGSHGAAACDAVVAFWQLKLISPSVRPGQEEQILRKAASSSHPYLPHHLTCFKLSSDPNIIWFKFFRFRLWPPLPIPCLKDQDWVIKRKHPLSALALLAQAADGPASSWVLAGREWPSPGAGSAGCGYQSSAPASHPLLLCYQIKPETGL